MTDPTTKPLPTREELHALALEKGMGSPEYAEAAEAHLRTERERKAQPSSKPAG